MVTGRAGLQSLMRPATYQLRVREDARPQQPTEFIPREFMSALRAAAPQATVAPQATAPQAEPQVAAPKTQLTGDPNVPRGYRNNNPLNIIDGSFARGQPGYEGTDGRFGRFASMDDGINAADRLLQSYADRGLNTPQSIIARWAPAGDGDNNPSAYAATIARNLGVEPGAAIDMANPTVRRQLIDAMATVENGRPMSPPKLADGGLIDLARKYADGGSVSGSAQVYDPAVIAAIAASIVDPQGYAGGGTATGVSSDETAFVPEQVQEPRTFADLVGRYGVGDADQVAAPLVDSARPSPGGSLANALLQRTTSRTPWQSPFDYLRPVGQGLLEILPTVKNYAVDVATDPNPFTRLGSDISTLGSAVWEGFKENPVETFFSVMPVSGELLSLKDADEFRNNQSYAYGAKYGISAEGQPQFTVPLSTGEELIISPKQYSYALDIIRKPSAGVIPNKNFKVTDTVGAPWYEREGVNRSKLDDILRQAAAGQAGVIRKALGGSISHEPGRFPGYTRGGYVQGYADGGSATASNSLADLYEKYYGEPATRQPPPTYEEMGNNPVGWSSVYPPQYMSNQDPNASKENLLSNVTLPGASRPLTYGELEAARSGSINLFDSLSNITSGGRSPPRQMAASVRGRDGLPPAPPRPGADAVNPIGIRAFHGSPPRPVKSLHGTMETFDKFDPSMRGTNFKDPISKSATFFTDNEKFARHYGDNVLEAILAAKNPHVVNVERELKAEWNISKSTQGYKGTFDKWIKENAPDGPYGFYEMGMMNTAIADARAAGKDLVTFDFGKLGAADVGQYKKVHAVLDDDIIEILRRYGLLGMVGGGAAAAGGKQAPSEEQTDYAQGGSVDSAPVYDPAVIAAIAASITEDNYA